MRGLTMALPMVALIGLAGCADQTVTMTFGDTDNIPAGFRQAECLEYQLKMEDMTLPVFTRNGAREDFHDKDCVYRSQDPSVGLFAPAA